MGCGSSTHSRLHQDSISIPLSTAQKYLVRETWETIDAHKNSVGKKTFLSPEFVNLKREELERANALHGHAKRVMKAVENAVTAMDDTESFAAYLEGLGQRHIARALKPSYLDAMQLALIETLQDLLESQWTEETADAWNILFRFIADTMKRGLQKK
ncbi:cytoglobin-1-like [Actinia tenebrosa]|uniref:Cytoglobin-1-like n=1 Tax=Actinia tenebrosa TaxID=6105 RepID=A0A6P8HW36_ACTTE|nr:cytoglobin-1-like [Actinia tenebrosa]